MLNALISAYKPCNAQETEDKRMMLAYLSLFSDVLFRTNEIAHFTASAWLVNPDRSKVLMAYHNIYNSWAWTGGHADGNACLLDVAMREAQEETGITQLRPVLSTPLSLEILPVNAHFKRGKYVVPHLHLNLTYLIEASDTQLTHAKPDENSAVKWFTPSDALSASTEPEMRVIYQKLIEKTAALAI